MEMKMTQREYEICKLLTHGYNNNQIAEILHVSTHTVKAHLTHLFYVNKDIINRTHLAYILGKENLV